MKKRAASLWAWARDHPRFSIVLAVVLVVASVGTAFLISLLPPPRGQECGQIDYPRDGIVNATMQAASMNVLSCFWHAYQHCQPATINLSAYGTDVGEEDTVTIEQKSPGCDVYYDKNFSGGSSYFGAPAWHSKARICTSLIAITISQTRTFSPLPSLSGRKCSFRPHQLPGEVSI